MSASKTWRTKTNGSNETELLGEKLGKALKGGEVIELVSDLGGGKTTFVRGLAKGIGSLDTVTSPTFTIRQEYNTKDLTLYHFDFYRLSEPGGIAHDLAEVVGKRDNVVVAEWADVVKGVMPAKRLTVHIKTTGETTRDFSFICPKSLEYLLKGMK